MHVTTLEAKPTRTRTPKTIEQVYRDLAHKTLDQLIEAGGGKSDVVIAGSAFTLSLQQ